MLCTPLARIAALIATAVLSTPLAAQQVTISVPYQNISTGYAEYIGGRWVYFGPGFGGAWSGSPFPVYGGFNPNAGLNGGFAFGGGGTGGMYNFTAASGGATTFVSETPFLTVTNGVPGTLTAGRFTPVVTGVVPVLGGGLANNPAFANLGAANSLSGRLQRGEFHIRDGQVRPGPDPLLALPPELAAAPLLFAPIDAPPPGAQAADTDAVFDGIANDAARGSSEDANTKALDLWRKGQALEAAGKAGAARLLYQTAARQATGVLRDQIESQLRGLQSSGKPVRDPD